MVRTRFTGIYYSNISARHHTVCPQLDSTPPFRVTIPVVIMSLDCPANFIAFTAPVNPPSAEPKLTLDQVWALLRRKVTHAHEFVPVAIKAVEVVSEGKDPLGRKVTTRIVTFVEGNRRVQEIVTDMYPLMERYARTDGSMVQDIVSQGADGELYLTFSFEMTKFTTALGEAEVAQTREAKLNGAKVSVKGTLEVMREMVLDGRWEEFNKNAI